MRRPPWWQVALATLAVIAVGLWLWRLLGNSAPAEAEVAPAALVTLAAAREANIDITVSAYGVVAGSPSASRTLSAPRAVIVQRLVAAPGQAVAAGAPLMVLADTPATALASRQAADAAAFAERDLARVRRLYDERLAANDQLSAATRAAADARSALAAQAATGAGGRGRILVAPAAGVVASVPATLGQQVAEGAPLVTFIAGGGLVAQLGVEPGQAGRLAPGQMAQITPVFDPARRLRARLSVVGRAVDPATRQVGVTAPIAGAGLALGDAVRATITVARHPALLVPRASVAYDEDGAHVFVVRAGKAHAARVTPGAEQGPDIEIAGAVRAGDAVAVDGAYQLEDGMAVRTARR